MFKYIISLLTILFLFSCQSAKRDKNGINFDEAERDTLFRSSSIEYVKKAKFIFYNMSSPIEMAQVFENSGSGFNEELLFDYLKYSNYSTSQKLAIMMGIYGVDLSYARMYDQSQISVKYLATIKKLAEDLGVPEDYVSLTTKNIENNVNNRDSLFQIANKAFLATNTYLKGNERESTASLILMGGWIEAIYIATSVFDPDKPNNELIRKIAEQKYSLNSLITLLRNDSDDVKISEYISLLTLLKNEFQHFNLSYDKTEFEFDTLSQEITIETNDAKIHPYHIESIRKIIIQIRKKITS